MSNIQTTYRIISDISRVHPQLSFSQISYYACIISVFNITYNIYDLLSIQQACNL